MSKKKIIDFCEGGIHLESVDMEYILRRALRVDQFIDHERTRIQQIRDMLADVPISGHIGGSGGRKGASDCVGQTAIRREKLWAELAHCQNLIEQRMSEAVRVEHILLTLDDMQRQLILLRCKDGCSWKHVARQMHMSQSTCQRWYLRAVGLVLRQWQG